jgi:hypothetical protein
VAGTWLVVRWLVMVKRMTYWSLIMHGTACIFPLVFSFFSSFSVITFSPHSLRRVMAERAAT